MKISNKLIENHGLKLEEYKKIKELLKREPNLLELGIFSAMWNEHCSYKSSKVHLKKLPTNGKHVIQGPGENAGVIDIGDNDAIVFKENQRILKKHTLLKMNSTDPFVAKFPFVLLK